MAQTVWVLGLYSVGVAWGLLLRRWVPFSIIVASGFLWGSLIWGLGILGFMLLGLTYTWVSIILLLGGTLFFCFWGHRRNRTWQLSQKEIALLLVLWLLHGGLSIAVTSANYATASTDSLAFILQGRSFAQMPLPAFSPYVRASQGIMLTVMQATATLLGDGYIYVLQPLTGFSYMLTFFALGQYGLYQVTKNKIGSSSVAGLATVVLVFTNFVFYQASYIHANFSASAYLFVAVMSLWLAMNEHELWLVFGMLGLLGYSFYRIEGPIFALIFLALLVSSNALTTRVKQISIWFFSSIWLIWYGRLILDLQGHTTPFFTPMRLLVMITVYSGLMIYVGLMNHRWLERWITPNLPWLTLLGLIGAVAVMTVNDPGHMQKNIEQVWRNLSVTGGWDNTWVFILVWGLISLGQPQFRNERVFVVLLLSWLLLIFLLGALRVPFRSGPTDSANRMMTHFITLSLSYLIMKNGHGLVKSDIWLFRNLRGFFHNEDYANE